jgi:hypothetical protein
LTLFSRFGDEVTQMTSLVRAEHMSSLERLGVERLGQDVGRGQSLDANFR